ncbi:MAG: VWA domain-containing protein [Deltaproteobacteria bacterium]|nr:VWA domain-containing protein [Deltaproteobacteria bacterium]
MIRNHWLLQRFRTTTLLVAIVLVLPLIFSSETRAWIEDDQGLVYQVEFSNDEDLELTAADKNYYCSVMIETSKIIWEATNGSHWIHTAHFYHDSTEAPGVTDVKWKRGLHGIASGGSAVNLMDVKETCSKEWFVDSNNNLEAGLYCRNPDLTCEPGPCYCEEPSCHDTERIRESQCLDSGGQWHLRSSLIMGWTAAHEIGHYMYDLHDEYLLDSCGTDEERMRQHYHVCVSDDGYTSLMGKYGRTRLCDHLTHLDSRPYLDEDGNILVDGNGDPYIADNPHHPDGLWNDIVDVNDKFQTHKLEYNSDDGYSTLPPYPSVPFNCIWHSDTNPGPSHEALVLLDKSGSMQYRDPLMSNDGPEAIESAAAAAVSYFNQGYSDRLTGIISFDTETHTVEAYEPKTNNLSPLGLDAGGSTDICKAIRDGADIVRQAYLDYDIDEAVGQQILLSDGRPTIPDLCDSVEDVIDAALYACQPGPGEVPVITSTVAFGEADHELLRKVAEACQGHAMSLPVVETTNNVGDTILITRPLQIQKGLARQGKNVRNYLEVLADDRAVQSINEYDIDVPVGTTQLTVEWMGDGFDYAPIVVLSYPPDPADDDTDCRFETLHFELESPTGQIIAIGDDPIAGEADYLTKTIKVELPDAGPWIARIVPDPEFRCLADSTDEHLWGDYDPRVATVASIRNRTLSPTIDLDTHVTGRNAPVQIKASMELGASIRVANISATAVVSRLDFQSLVTLYDDGAHGDDDADDGIYGGVFNEAGDTLAAGGYRIEVTLQSDESTAIPAEDYDFIDQLGVPIVPPMPTATLREESSFVLRDCVITPGGDAPNECSLDRAIPRIENDDDPCKFTLEPGRTYYDLRVDTVGLPIGADDIYVNLGLDIDVMNVRVNYDATTKESTVLFDATVGSTALSGPREVRVTYGSAYTVTSHACLGEAVTGRILLVANGYYPQEAELYAHLTNAGHEVVVRKDYKVRAGTDLSSYDLIIITGFAPNISNRGLNNIESSGKPVFIIEYWDFWYSYKLDLLSDDYGMFGNNTLEVLDFTHPVTQGLPSVMEAYDPPYYAFGVVDWSVMPGTKALVGGPTWGQISVLADDARKIVSMGLHEIEDLTDDSERLLDRSIKYLLL